MQEYLTWPDDQQRRYQSDAEKVNDKWIEKKLRHLNAVWLIVVDGQIIAHGPTMQTFPHEEEFDRIFEKYEKYPFVFFNPKAFIIEETAAWNSTTIPGDAYPTIQIGLKKRPHLHLAQM